MSSISRRDILGLSVIGGAFPWCVSRSEAAAASVSATIVDQAREYLRTTDWEPTPSYFDGQSAYYCNEFVAFILRKAGAATWSQIQRPTLFPRFRDPLASEWADTAFAIRGWTVIHPTAATKSMDNASSILNLREPGDVIAGGGHVGILSDQKNDAEYRLDNYVSARHLLAISASSTTGAVEMNAWSSRIPDVAKYKDASKYTQDAAKAVSRFTVRRFVGA